MVCHLRCAAPRSSMDILGAAITTIGQTFFYESAGWQPQVGRGAGKEAAHCYSDVPAVCVLYPQHNTGVWLVTCQGKLTQQWCTRGSWDCNTGQLTCSWGCHTACLTWFDEASSAPSVAWSCRSTACIFPRHQVVSDGQLPLSLQLLQHCCGAVAAAVPSTGTPPCPLCWAADTTGTLHTHKPLLLSRQDLGQQRLLYTRHGYQCRVLLI